jgi:hypothetical protein
MDALKTLSTLLLSLAIALPSQQALAVPQPIAQPAAVTDDGSDVLIEQGSIHGKPVTMILTTSTRERERAEVRDLANQFGSGLEVLVDATKAKIDPTLAGVEDSRNSDDVKVFQVDKTEDSALARTSAVSATTKRGFFERVKHITHYVKENTFGLTGVIIYSGVVAQSAFHISSSVEAGLAVLIPFLALNGYIASHEHSWRQAMNRSGEIHANAISSVFSLFGKKVTSAGRKILEASGRFNMTWLASFAGVALVRVSTGTWDGFLEAAMTALLFNYSAWDPTALKKFAAWGWSKARISLYFFLVYVAGSYAESQTYQGNEFVPWVLGAVVGSGALWVMQGSEIESFIARTWNKLRLKVGKNRAARLATQNQHCAESLALPEQRVAGE